MLTMTAPVYPPPSWSAEPSHLWQLLEIKAGHELGTHLLQTALITFGRAADVVTVPLAHESCSRLHARIAFDSSGQPWLRDLASTHGVTVNKRRLPQEAISKVEPADSTVKGSRGVMLFPGDTIQFGASSRIYVLEGPPEMERGAMEIKRKIEQIQQQNAPPTAVNQPREDPTDEPTATDSDPSVALTKLDASQLSENLRKQYESINTKKAKLENVETEAERIQCKGELSDGQKRQLALNQDRITKLHEEIAESEKALYEKLFGKVRKEQEQQFAANEEEDVDDRTAKKRPITSTMSRAEDEASLTQKWKLMQGKWIQSRQAVEKTNKHILQLKRKLQSLAEGDDEIFYLQNDIELASDNLARSEKKKVWLEVDLKEIESLLLLVNDKLKFDRESGCIGNKRLQEVPREESMPVPNTISPTARGGGVLLPPSNRSKPIIPTASSTLKFSADESSSMPPPGMMMPPTKRTRIVPPMSAPPAQGPSQNAAPIGTLAFLISGDGSSQEIKAVKNQEKSTFDAKKDVWVTPIGQDGSGRTKLNEKFGGRY